MGVPARGGASATLSTEPSLAKVTVADAYPQTRPWRHLPTSRFFVSSACRAAAGAKLAWGRADAGESLVAGGSEAAGAGSPEEAGAPGDGANEDGGLLVEGAADATT